MEAPPRKEAKEGKSPPFFIRTSASDLELVEQTQGMDLSNLSHGGHSELYEPTEAMLNGAVRGVHGHTIHEISTGLVRRARTYFHGEKLIQELHCIHMGIEREWEAWRTHPQLSFYKRDRKGTMREGLISAHKVREVWNSDAITRHGAQVIEAQWRQIQQLIVDIDRFGNNNPNAPNFYYGETHPGVEILLEQEIYGRNITLRGNPESEDGLGMQVSLRPDMMVGNNIIIDCKYSQGAGKITDVVRAQAYLYCLLGKAFKHNPENRFVYPEYTSVDDMRFYLKVFNAGLSPYYDYVPVAVSNEEGLALLIRYASLWKENAASLRLLRKRRSMGFYLPQMETGVDFFAPRQPNLF